MLTSTGVLCKDGPDHEMFKYICSQVKTHRLLRDLTEDYLNEAPVDQLGKDESENKLVATLLIIFFEEHVAITERLSKEMGLEEI